MVVGLCSQLGSPRLARGLAITPREPEAAWHRRLRKQRSLARAVVIVAKAGYSVPEADLQQAVNFLEQHHGTPRDMVRDGGKKLEWLCCKGCKGRHGKAFVNRVNNRACHLCGLDKSVACGK